MKEIENLEIKICYIEDTLDKLNQAILDLIDKTNKLEKKIQKIENDKETIDKIENSKPPHY